MTRIKKQIRNSRQGFTLIELMVVMAIIGILAATAIVNFGQNEDRDVRAEKDHLTTFLREVQNKALAGETPSSSLISDCYPAGKFTCNKICGYGIESAAASSVSLQAYFAYDTNVDSDCTNFSSMTKKDLEIYYIKNGVTISSPNDVFFRTPDSKIFKDSSVLSGSVNILLTKGSMTLNPPISIDASGRIY